MNIHFQNGAASGPELLDGNSAGGKVVGPSFKILADVVRILGGNDIPVGLGRAPSAALCIPWQGSQRRSRLSWWPRSGEAARLRSPGAE
jgi:hypothetical protein